MGDSPKMSGRNTGKDSAKVWFDDAAGAIHATRYSKEEKEAADSSGKKAQEDGRHEIQVDSQGYHKSRAECTEARIHVAGYTEGRESVHSSENNFQKDENAC
nr:hypothetical protein CFP56_20632 [Quercus suber]